MDDLVVYRVGGCPTPCVGGCKLGLTGVCPRDKKNLEVVGVVGELGGGMSLRKCWL